MPFLEVLYLLTAFPGLWKRPLCMHLPFSHSIHSAAGKYGSVCGRLSSFHFYDTSRVGWLLKADDFNFSLHLQRGSAEGSRLYILGYGEACHFSGGWPVPCRRVEADLIHVVLITCREERLGCWKFLTLLERNPSLPPVLLLEGRLLHLSQ